MKLKKTYSGNGFSTWNADDYNRNEINENEDCYVVADDIEALLLPFNAAARFNSFVGIVGPAWRSKKGLTGYYRIRMVVDERLPRIGIKVQKRLAKMHTFTILNAFRRSNKPFGFLR